MLAIVDDIAAVDRAENDLLQHSDKLARREAFDTIEDNASESKGSQSRITASQTLSAWSTSNEGFASVVLP